MPFTKEVSVVCARGLDGGFARLRRLRGTRTGNHILHRTLRRPAAIAPATAADAVTIRAKKIADALAYVGVLGGRVLRRGGRRECCRRESLAVNEIAPRVHNSGHWTEVGAVTSQFEQHVRAICGWPLGATTRHGAARRDGKSDRRRRGLTGPRCWREPGVSLHLYGKEEVRPGRKMGHWTRVID